MARRAQLRHRRHHPLIAEARVRLQAEWGRRAPVGAVHAAYGERAVFETTGPDGPAVVKIGTSTREHVAERAALYAAADAGLPVPRVIHHDPVPPALLVLERLNGTFLGKTPAREPWQDAGRWLRRLHDVPPPADIGTTWWSHRGWRDHFLWWADQEHEVLRARDLVAPAALDRMHRVLTGVFAAMEEPPLRLLHGDCQPHHYLVAPSGDRIVGIFDFGDAVRGDPAWDVAVLTLKAPSVLPNVLTGYEPDAALEARLHDLLPAYQLMARLGAATWMRDHGFDDRPDLSAATALLAHIDR